LIKFRLRGELTVQKEITHFKMFCTGGEGFNGIATISKDPSITIDVSDLGFAAGCRKKARIKCEQALADETAHVDHIKTSRRLKDRQRNRFAVDGNAYIMFHIAHFLLLDEMSASFPN